MGRMAELELEIVELLNEGNDAHVIAKKLGIPEDWVLDVEESARGDDYDDSMDGDHESALASAGWGTDEDYGASCCEDY